MHKTFCDCCNAVTYLNLVCTSQVNQLFGSQKTKEKNKMSKAKRKQPPPYFYSGEHEAKKQEEDETSDAYNTKQREQMLDDDEMTAAEAGFMRGREQEPPSKKLTRSNAISHDDSTSVELAKEDSEDD